MLDDGAKLFAYLDAWYLWVKPQCLADALDLVSACTRMNQSRAPALQDSGVPDPVPPELIEKVKPTLNYLGGRLHIHGEGEPSPVVLGDHATMDKTIRRFREISATVAELNAEGLHAQTVHDLLAMYVGAASQHVLRISCVPEDEAKRFDTEVIGFWSQLIQRDATSSLSTCLSNLAAWALAQLNNGTRPPPGVLGRLSFPPS